MLKLIFGIGTGRCGTQALATFLNLQKINALHERLLMPWDFDLSKLTELTDIMLKDSTSDYPIVAEVNFSLLNYVRTLMQKPFTVKVFCLKRDRDETIKSWLNNQKNYNLWSNENHLSFSSGLYLKNDALGKSFPKYDLDKKEAIAAYYDDYYREAYALENEFPDRFRIFDMKSVLSEESVQVLLLDFLEIAEENRFIHIFKNKIDDKPKDEDVGILFENLDLLKPLDSELLQDFSPETVKFLTHYNLLKIILDKDDAAMLTFLSYRQDLLLDLAFSQLSIDFNNLDTLSKAFIAKINLDSSLYNYFPDTVQVLKKQAKKNFLVN